MTNPESDHQENYTKKAVHGVVGVVLALLSVSVLSYFLRLVLAKELSPDEFGLFYSTLSFMMFMLIFRNFGMTSAITRYVAHYSAEKNYSKMKRILKK